MQNKIKLWAGRIISGLCVLFLVVDATMKIFRATPSVEGTISLDFSDSLVQPLGVVILIFTILYGIPRTSIFGAILLTAHFGGAVAVFIQKFWGHASFLFPMIFCIMLWIGLFLRDASLRSIVPIKKHQQ
jgi:hypothetical protein